MSSKADYINNFVKVYRNLSEFPTVNCAYVINRNCNPDFIKVTSVWNQRNIEIGEIIKFQKSFIIQVSSSKIIFESEPCDVHSQELSKTSVSEKFRCIIRKTKQDNKKKQFIEIWTQNGLFRNFDVSAFDIHGEIYCDEVSIPAAQNLYKKEQEKINKYIPFADKIKIIWKQNKIPVIPLIISVTGITPHISQKGEFGSLEWSPNEEQVLYVAEKKLKKSESFYKQKSAEASNQNDEKSTVTGDEYIFKENWGEQLVDKHQPVVCICDIKSETLKVLEGIPSNFSPGQLLWSKDGSGIFGVVFENEPRHLGLIYCTNRLSYIFHMTLNGGFKILSEINKSVRSPRLSPDGNNLFWLQRPVGGVHNGCQELVKLDLATYKITILISIVRSVDTTFSGLYLHNLPTRCFSKDGTKLFFSSCNKLKISSYYLDIDTAKIHLLETGEESATILDVHDNIVLITAGSLKRTPALKISKSWDKIKWIPVTKSEIICNNSVVKEMEFESNTGNHKFTYYNALYYGPSEPTSGQKVPLILYPHGGPHSAVVNDYAFEPNFFVTIGYGVLMVNYRGSTGAGQDGIEFLQGKISDTDVKDNHEAVLNVLKSIPYLDANNIFLYGKSHGGFLVEQLSGQYPNFYRAVVSGNPVTDVLAMYIMSDIPDWATSECGLNFDESKPLTMKQINKMIEVSPIQLLDKIKAPTLFLIGKKDLRVPYYGGVKMYQSLKARKVKVRLNLYDDNHTLGNVPNHIDCLINTALWFLDHKA